MIKGNPEEYGKPAQLLHWVIAILVFIILAILMSGQPANPEIPVLLKAHILIGAKKMKVNALKGEGRMDPKGGLRC